MAPLAAHLLFGLKHLIVRQQVRVVVAAAVLSAVTALCMAQVVAAEQPGLLA
jgi:hypothetical protein